MFLVSKSKCFCAVLTVLLKCAFQWRRVLYSYRNPPFCEAWQPPLVVSGHSCKPAACGDVPVLFSWCRGWAVGERKRERKNSMGTWTGMGAFRSWEVSSVISVAAAPSPFWRLHPPTWFHLDWSQPKLVNT